MPDISQFPRWNSANATRLLAPLSLCAMLLLSACGKSKAPPPAAAPPEVGVVTIQTQDAPYMLDLPGRLSASLVAEIRPQVGGIVEQRLFTEGAMVRAGQPLYQLEASAFEAERARTAAALQKAQAQVGQARTRAARDAELFKIDALSRQSAEDSASALTQAEADAAVAKAALDAATVQLRRARINSPISGRIEISTVTPGALVTANQADPLTRVQQLDPMHVDIVQSSAELLQLRRDLAADTGSRQFKLMLEDGSEHPQPGTLRVSGVTVDPATGAVTLRATVPNPGNTLLPGMVVRARLLAGVDRDALLVPQEGVTRSPTGEATALVVGAGNKVELRRLQVRRAVGNRWLVTGGVQAGERVIVEGLQRARAGAVVTPVAAGSAPAGAASAPASAPASAASAGASR